MVSQRVEVWYRGHVQGVGFRYTTTSIARRFSVTGYVENLPDGRVHLVAEGPQDEMSQFLAQLESHMGQFIRDSRQDRREATGEFSSFEIRH